MTKKNNERERHKGYSEAALLTTVRAEPLDPSLRPCSLVERGLGGVSSVPLVGLGPTASADPYPMVSAVLFLGKRGDTPFLLSGAEVISLPDNTQVIFVTTSSLCSRFGARPLGQP